MKRIFCINGSYHKTKSATDLKSYDNSIVKLAIVERELPWEANKFFQQLVREPFNVFGKISKSSTLTSIETMLDNIISNNIQKNPFYAYWLKDMADICELFCETENSCSIGFSLGTNRGCRHFHVDQVPQRLLVTYSGKGTEWLPEDHANYQEYLNGSPNEKIVKENCKTQLINQWNIAIFRGGPSGLLHRTPDEALEKLSILMRLDHESFYN